MLARAGIGRILCAVNKLTTDERARVISALVEGNSLRATARMTGTHRTTILKLLAELGTACAVYQDRVFRNLPCKSIQVDEIWSFCGAKEKNTTTETRAKGWGDVWTWTSIDPETKLMPCWLVANRTAPAAFRFMDDLASRMANRIQLTSDGLQCYLPAVAEAFGTEVDYAQLVKIYGEGPKTEARYSPAQCMGARKAIISGSPDFRRISTSHVERSNLTIRMGNRRFTRLTNGFSKKVENHKHSVALHLMHYNFCRIHQSLRVTPAMQAGISDHLWSLEELVGLLDSSQAKAA